MIALAALSILVAGCAPAAKVTGLARSMGWVAQQSGTGDGLMGVCFTSVNDGWAVGEGGMLLATLDGGAHWHSVSCGTWDDLFAVTFTDRSHGWLLGGDEVIRTADAGKHWSVARLGSGGSGLALQALAFTDRLHGIAAGVIARGDHQVGIIFCTSDGGENWRTAWKQSPTFPFTKWQVYLQHAEGVKAGTVGLRAIGVIDRRHLVVTDGGGVVLASRDGGASWSLLANSDTNAIGSLVFPTRSRGWAVGSSGRVMESRDGGRTWRLRQTLSRYPLYQIAFASKTDGWIVGGDGTLFRTTDGGVHWTAVPGLLPVASPQAEAFVGPDHGWVVGDNGSIYAYR
jgi:photosystem II stability/assembly factor-like uncharacterized protein